MPRPNYLCAYSGFSTPNANPQRVIKFRSERVAENMLIIFSPETRMISARRNSEKQNSERKLAKPKKSKN